ncbi:MAG: hypothetical protein KatS3mg122_2495 [Caldimonas sp.]|nr:MAG: hypothetical protein KatS3mg122_2495 [Caldimonas sp.]
MSASVSLGRASDVANAAFEPEFVAYRTHYGSLRGSRPGRQGTKGGSV